MKAAQTFVRVNELEADLSAIGAAPQHIGLTYATRNKGVAGIMRSIQKIMSQVQDSQCSASYAIFLKQKTEIITLLQTSSKNQPISCAEVSAAINGSADMLKASLASLLPPGLDTARITAEIQVMWKTVATQVCDPATNKLDYRLLDAFMTALFDAMCGKKK